MDLDGTFIKSDMLHESFLVAVKNNPFIIFLCIWWLLKGKAHLKHQLSNRAEIDVALIPLNADFYSFLIKEKEKNRQIILATASTEKYAKAFCKSYKLFDSYISSDERTNLKERAKLEQITSVTNKFAYAGNSCADHSILKSATDKYLVNPGKKAKKTLSDILFSETYDDHTPNFRTWLKQLRIHQWLKNLLIFVPLLVSGLYTNYEFIILSVLGFFSFSFLASATYIVNDLLDLESDRSHARKKHRPLASGQISIASGITMAAILLLSAFAIAMTIRGLFVFVLLGYLTLTLTYSFKIKEYVGADVITLASLYTLRILAGTAILNVTVSFWLLSFSMFVFLSLALIKRCSELKLLERQEKTHAQGRDYNIGDFNLLMSFGTSSALLSVLMFCFYINSSVLTDQYQTPDLLWIIIPAFSYWLLRMWIKTNRGEMHDDPIIFTFKDKGSKITIGFIIFITILAQIL